MEMASLPLSLAVLILGLIVGAFRFMRFLGVLTGSDRKAKMRNLYPESHLSFDERVAEKLREMERERR